MSFKNAIYKYPLFLGSCLEDRGQEIKVPDSFQPLSIQIQAGELVLWGSLQTDRQLPERKIRVKAVGTGMEYPITFDKDSYLTTIQGGVFVWHFFIKEF